MSESFNSVIAVPREKPIVTMLEDIRVYLMEMWETNRKKVAKYENSILPNIRKRIDRESSYTNNWLVRQISEFDFEVRHISLSGDKYGVNLRTKECSCRKWLLTGLPCTHAMSCMKKQGIDIDKFVPDCFRKEAYEACYSSIIYPANGQSLWTKTEYTDLQPPPIKRQSGRPKKKRIKDADEKRDENELKRARYGIKCSRCKQEGHNKSTCKLPPPPPPQPPAASQPTSSQPTASQPTASSTQHAPAPATATVTKPAAASLSQPDTATKQKKSETAKKKNAAEQKTKKQGKTQKKKENAPKIVSSSQPTPSTNKLQSTSSGKKSSTLTKPQN